MTFPRLAPLLVAFSLGLSATGAAGADGAGAEAFEAVQKTAIEWTRLRTESIRLQSEWARERALLESTATALQEHIATLTQRREVLDAETAVVRAEIEALRTRHAALVQSVGAMEARVAALVAGLEQLRPSLPPRLSVALELPYRSLADARSSTTEKAQHALAILSRCLQFNKTITYSEEILGDARSPDARVAEVLYWGLAEAYAIDRVSGKAYLGQPAQDGWAWASRDDAFAQIQRLIDVHKDAVEPEFVELPARLVTLPGAEVRP